VWVLTTVVDMMAFGVGVTDGDLRPTIVWGMPHGFVIWVGELTSIWYTQRHILYQKLIAAPLSVQAALADPRGPEVGLRELAAKLMEMIENE
jgi:hypothetical protein